MAISSDDVFAKHMTKDQLDKADLRAKQLVAEYQTLQTLRKSQNLTQVDMAETLGMTQDNISRLEKRPDVLISSLHKYIQGLGGELDLIVRFPDSDPVILDGYTKSDRPD